ncbi:hypothetical protein ACWC9S_20960 [Streptomyces xiamenensis]
MSWLLAVVKPSGLPLLFVEDDTCHMDAQCFATKLDKYMRFFKRTVKDGRNRQTPMWRTRWDVGGDITELLVAERSSEHWQGHKTEYGYHNYDGRIPLVFTTIDVLREHGPTAPVFHRAGRDKPQTLIDAVGDPVRDAVLARERALQQDEQWESDPELRRTVMEPDGVHCAACRKELNPLPERAFLGRLWRGY